MFRHQGKTRTLSHNLKIASLLSFVAGTVNVAGFFAVQCLTTNVTGHFAFFVDEVFKLNFWQGFVYFLYINTKSKKLTIVCSISNLANFSLACLPFSSIEPFKPSTCPNLTAERLITMSNCDCRSSALFFNFI